MGLYPKHSRQALSAVQHNIRKHHDDLDYCEEALLETDSGQLFMLKHYARSPGPKHTNIFGNERIKNPIQEWNEIVAVLELTKAEVIAVHPALLESPEWD